MDARERAADLKPTKDANGADVPPKVNLNTAAQQQLLAQVLDRIHTIQSVLGIQNQDF